MASLNILIFKLLFKKLYINKNLNYNTVIIFLKLISEITNLENGL